MVKGKYNVVFIMSDQQRSDMLDHGFSKGYENMLKLRDESVSFKGFYTASLPCVPSRHVFLTGRNAWKLGCHGNGKFSMDNLETTWMGILRDNGYSCVSVGKTHMVHSGSFHIQVPPALSFSGSRQWDHFNPMPTPEKDSNFYDIHTACRACDALQRLKDEGLFAMFIGFHAPHAPHIMPEKYLNFCKPEEVSLPVARCAGEYQMKSQAYRERVNLYKDKFGGIDDDMVLRGIAGYRCSLKMIDDCIGMVMRKMEELNLLSNTVVIYTSDHGELQGEHWLFGKAASFYEGEVRIPFMIRFPDGYMAGTQVSGLASSIDFVPTILDVLGIDADITLPGKSLIPSIDKGKTNSEYVISSINGAMMIRNERYKLWYDSRYKDGELYDLENDPYELENLYFKKEFNGLRAELFELMLNVRLIEDVKDNLPTAREKSILKTAMALYGQQIY